MKKTIYIIILSIGLGCIMGWYLNQDPKLNSNNDKHFNTTEEHIKNQDTETLIKEKYNYCNNIISHNPLIVEYAENASCNCDSANSTLEINYCSGVVACLEEKRFDSLNNRLLQIYDALIVEQNNETNNLVEQGDSSMLEHITNYKKIKNLHIESTNTYLKYAELEMTISGIEIGTDRLSTFYENNRWTKILEIKNKELELLINELVEE